MRVFIVDDDDLVAISLKTILEADARIEVAGIGRSGAQAILQYRKLQPDILLMDIRMEGMTGLQAAEEILKEFKDAKILFLTTFSDDEYIVKALHIGVKGYLLKQDFEGIAPALHAVYGGQSVFGGEIVGKLPVLLDKRGAVDYSRYDITRKEQEMIALVAEGLSNREIAAELYLSEGTVRNYISIILEKLGLRDRTQLAVFYYKNR